MPPPEERERPNSQITSYNLQLVLCEIMMLICYIMNISVTYIKRNAGDIMSMWSILARESQIFLVNKLVRQMQCVILPACAKWVLSRHRRISLKSVMNKESWIYSLTHPVLLSINWQHNQGGVKSTPTSPRLRVWVILTDPEPTKEALWFSYSD